MKLGLIGYGKMGKAIEAIALERGHQVLFTTSSANPLSPELLYTVDVAIEFTKPELAIQHIETALTTKTPIIVGTTGWNDDLDKVVELVTEHQGALLYASNFSIGVNVLFEINQKLAALMSAYPEYAVSIEETHHIQKLDAPSGTAISLANGILDNNEAYFSWVSGEGAAPHINPGQVGITAHRVPDVPGTHTVAYTSEIDTISITHEAHNRRGFALGAVIAAEWIMHKQGIFSMRDVLNTKTL